MLDVSSSAAVSFYSQAEANLIAIILAPNQIRMRWKGLISGQRVFGKAGWMKTIQTKLSSEMLIAPCGLNCAVCHAHLRAKNTCPGCRAEDALKPRTRVICKIKTCEKMQQYGFEYCFECDEFPCGVVKHLDKRYSLKYGTSVIDNLSQIRASGIPSFLMSEEKKWTCPGCGSLLCMHEPQCLSCAYVWNR
jgi:hypothetical protein